VPNGDSATPAIGSPTKHELSDTRPNGNANGTSGPALLNGVSNGEAPPTPVIIPPSGTATPVPELPLAPTVEEPAISSYDIIQEAAKSPLDAVIAASISMCGTENKVKAAASSILLIGGSGALKGLGAFIAER
jgi:actin-related protein 8